MTDLFLTCLICYSIGSIPFGLIFTKIFLKKDIRLEGSGNIGATNVLRTSGKWLGALTLLFDAGKGYVASIIAYDFNFLFFGALAAFLGHLFPIWLKFKGGKGVATYVGILLYLSWVTSCVGITIWVLIFVCTRISSLSALVAAIAIPIWSFIYVGKSVALLTVLMSCLLIMRHHENIRRLARGEEKKM